MNDDYNNHALYNQANIYFIISLDINVACFRISRHASYFFHTYKQFNS